MPLRTTPLDIADFSGGITDNHVGAPPNRYQKADNFVINKHGGAGKIESRPGSILYNTAGADRVTTNDRIGALKFHNGELLAFTDNKLEHIVANAWTEIQGPVTSNSLFSTSTTTSNVFSIARSNDHLIVVNDAFEKPQKIFPDASETMQLRTAGLPRLASAPTCTPGAGANSYLYQFTHSYEYTVKGSVTFLDESSLLSANVEVTSADAPNSTAVAITSIPVLANGASDNYDTANIKIKIYRTTNGGTQFFYVGEVTNGTTTFNDTVSDATLQDNALLYTEGDILENDEPPPAKVVTVVEDTAYYGHVKEGTETISNRIRQSVPGDFDSCPAELNIDLDDEIVGLSSVRNFPVAVCKSSVYRIEGKFDETFRGGMTSIQISDTSSCVSSQSVVQTLEGIFWAGLDGFYFCNGYKVMKISDELDETYKALVDTDAKKLLIQGKYDEKTRRVWWVCQKEIGSTDVDTAFILHLEWGLSDQSVFTTASGGDWSSNFAPSAIEFDNDNEGILIRADVRGYVFKHDDTSYSDPKIDTTVSSANWDTYPVIYDYRSTSFNFGSDFMRKYVPRMNIIFKNITNASVQIKSNNDDNRLVADLAPIRFRGNLVWGDPDPIWGDDDLIWDFDGLIVAMRRFPKRSLRTSYKQIQITNAKVVTTSSDVLGNATMSTVLTTKTLTLDDAVNVDFPADSIDQFVSFANDLYVREYQITAVTADTITFEDPGGNAPSSGSIPWVIRGKPKDEALRLLAYTLHWAALGKTQDPFRSADTGEVGAV